MGTSSFTESVLHTFTITARRAGSVNRTLRLMATSPAHAILVAAELLPGWLLSVPSLTPEWQ